MPKYGKPIVAEGKSGGRQMKYSRDHYAEMLRLRLKKGLSLQEISKQMMIPKTTVYRMVRV